MNDKLQKWQAGGKAKSEEKHNPINDAAVIRAGLHSHSACDQLPFLPVHGEQGS